MALILGVSKGKTVFVGDTPIKVMDCAINDHIMVQCEGKTYRVTDRESVEVLPDVFLSLGKPAKQPNYYGPPRLIIDAPRDMLILREELYARSKAGISDPYADSQRGFT